MGFKDIFKQRFPIKILSGGHILTKKPLPTPIQVANVTKGKAPGQIIIEVPFADKTPFQLKGIEWEESHARSGGKAAVGAIAGSVVAGPLGTIAGAAVGGKRKDTSKAFLILEDQEGTEHQLHIHCDQNLYVQLSGLMG
ncbi:hypothetical protein [Robertmurraya siralis]|uniref:hypothetical protein n=1 Tax=Robertmurraya siralis TaxID=77777 RepID=UPI0010F757BC|nr:hypothetical protein [Robertmurraya siralis]